MGLPSRYIAIDSLKQQYVTSHIFLDLKRKSLDVEVKGLVITFYQKYEVDPISRYYFHHRLIENKWSGGATYLQVRELLSFDNDSIYVKALCLNSNLQGKVIGKNIRFDRLAISRNELLGVVVSPTKRQRTTRFSIMAAFTLALGSLGVAMD